uniref:Cytochrome P450 n=1 Tax=Megaselia scalaris TaxID=36166 RepID=T1GMF0_MEGSC
MYPTVETVSKNLESYINKIPSTDNNRDIRHITSLFATDIIASVAFGLEVNSFEDPDNEFLKNGHQNFALNIIKAAQLTSAFFLPRLVPWVKARGFEEPIENFFRRIFDFVFEERQKTGVFRNDLIDILISLNNSSESGVEFTGDVLRAQSAVFYAAGFHTISNTIAFALYELAKQPHLQDKLRKEISKEDSSSYEAIVCMDYLNMILQETLRLYPTLAFLDREATLEEDEVYSLKPYSNFEIPNGMPIYIPQAAIYRDPKYFPDPNKFVPERFSAENRDTFISGSYMPFGIGPHKCIGERIGALIVKLGIYNILKNHKVEMRMRLR